MVVPSTASTLPIVGVWERLVLYCLILYLLYTGAGQFFSLAVPRFTRIVLNLFLVVLVFFLSFFSFC